MSKSRAGHPPATPSAAAEPAGEGFLARWSRRKSRARQAPAAPAPESRAPAAQGPRQDPAPEAGSAPPPLESLDEHSDYSAFLSPEVSEHLQRLALRKLFHSAKFNLTDGLDDYAEDYRSFAALGDVVTADMRYDEERRARLAAEEGRSGAEGEAAGATDPAQSAEASGGDAPPGPGDDGARLANDARDGERTPPPPADDPAAT